MTTVLAQTALLLLLGQVIMGAVGFAVPRGLPWIGLPVIVVLLWLVVRTGKVLRNEMEQARKRRVPVVPWQMALWATLLWQWPSVLLLPRGSWAPAWLGQVWNGAALPVQGTVGLFSETAANGMAPWLWVAVVLEAALFCWVAGRPLARRPAPRQAAAPARMAAGGEWAPARRHKDVAKRSPVPSDKQ